MLEQQWYLHLYETEGNRFYELGFEPPRREGLSVTFGNTK